MCCVVDYCPELFVKTAVLQTMTSTSNLTVVLELGSHLVRCPHLEAVLVRSMSTVHTCLVQALDKLAADTAANICRYLLAAQTTP